MLRPAGLDPHFFIEQGLADREKLVTLLSDGPTGVAAALTYEESRLANFRRWGPWDAQRIGGKYHAEHVDYATVAIGLYAAAAGIPENLILIIQDEIAKDSHYKKGTEFDSYYIHLPKSNVKNTHTGYYFYNKLTNKQ